MPAIVTWGGVVLAVLGLLIALAGLPDHFVGIAMGSHFMQAGGTIFIGGLILAALGRVLQALKDVGDRIEEAGFSLSSPRQSLNDERGARTPMPLPRAGGRNADALIEDEIADELAAPPAREPRGARSAPPSQRVPQAVPSRGRPPLPEQQRSQPRIQGRPPLQPEPDFDAQSREDDFADDFSSEPKGQRQEPRWMRSQQSANDRQQAPGTIPLQKNAGRGAPPAPPRRESSPAVYEGAPQRRRPLPESLEEEMGEATVERSGIIGGMAYTLYSDGSIEAELPAGTVRFGSIQELQEHVKRAGIEEQEDYRGPQGAPH